MAANGPFRTVRRIFQLWGVHARLDFLFMTRDLKTFVMWAVSDTVLNVAAVTGMLLLAQRFAGIGRWSQFQFVFLLGYAALVDGIVAVFFSYNVNFISRRLGRGQLDHTLIQPQPIWMSLLTEGFSPAFGIPMLLPGLGMMAWALHRMQMALTPLWMARLGVSLVSSAVVVLAFQFLWGSLAFWAPRAAEEINSSTMSLMSGLKSFPLDGLSPLLAGGLLTVLPVGFVAWAPCRSLMGLDRSAWGAGSTPLAAVAFALLAVYLFRRGMRHYGRVGSQRYSGWGHRS